MKIPPQLSRAPFVAYAGALCGGILLFYRAGISFLWGVGIGALGIALWLALTLRRSPLPYARRDLMWLPPLLCFLSLGMAAAYLHRPVNEADIPDGYLARGTVAEAACTDFGTRLSVDVESLTPRRRGADLPLHTRVYLYTDSAAAAPGDRIVFPALLRLPEGTDDYRRFLFSRGIDFTASLPGEFVARAGSDEGVRARVFRLRSRITATLDSSRLDPATASFLKALLTGDRSGIDPETRRAFAGAGIAHLLAVSGLHVGILVALILALLLPLDLTGSRVPRYLLALLSVWCFALFTGAGAPVVRAAVMASCLLAGMLLQRPHSAVNSLCLAAFIILLFNPRALFDAGFLLSFGVTAGIILLAPPLTPFADRKHRRLRKALLWVTVPCVAFLCSWVTSAVFFHSVPLLFLPLNLLLAPLLPLYFSLGLLHAAFLLWGFDPAWSASLLDAGYGLLAGGADIIGNLPRATAEIWLPEAAAWLYLLAMLCFACMLTIRGRGWIAGASVCMILATVAVVCLPPPIPPHTLSLRGDRSACAVVSVFRGEREVVLLPRDSVTGIGLHGKTVIFLDADIKLPPEPERIACHWLVIGSGYRGPAENIELCFKADSVLCHPSLSLDRMDELAGNLPE